MASDLTVLTAPDSTQQMVSDSRDSGSAGRTASYKPGDPRTWMLS